MNVRYEIVVSTFADGLADKINTRLADGWSLWGGPAVVMAEGSPFLFQAVVKVERPELSPQVKANMADALRVKAWLLANGAPVSLANAVGYGFTPGRSGTITTLDGVITLSDGVTLEQFRRPCADPQNTIQIARVGIAGVRQLRAIAQGINLKGFGDE